MKGWREHAADVFTEQGSIAAKMKFAPGPDLSDFQLLHHSLPHQWGPYDVYSLGGYQAPQRS